MREVWVGPKTFGLTQTSLIFHLSATMALFAFSLHIIN